MAIEDPRTAISATLALTRAFATEGRRVLVPWRALIYLRRATESIPDVQRRWRNLPRVESDVSTHIRNLLLSGSLRELRDYANVFTFETPFAETLPTAERELLFELNPFAVLSHYSALELHGFTHDRPQVITASTANSLRDQWIPLGTIEAEWHGVRLPNVTRPGNILEMPVEWSSLQESQLDGIEEHSDRGIPIRVTNPERTLVDALASPERSGGIVNVLNGWVLAQPFVDVAEIISLTEHFNTALLRQKIGYVLESLGHRSTVLDRWAKQAKSGGAYKLVGSEPYSGPTDERWKIAINGPIWPLEESQ